MTLIIPDISFWQYGYKDPPRDWTITRYVDFVKMKQQTPAVILRAGQNTWADRTFAISRTNATAAAM